MEKNAKRVLLINDLPGYGKAALAAMTPILSKLGHYPFLLPTAVISNTLDFGKYRIEDMTDYMRDSLRIWEELGFDYDCICTGYVLNEKQVDLIAGFLNGLADRKKRLVIVDPIMADGGRLYHGIGSERIVLMRRLAACADVMTPNITEAGFLTGLCPGAESGTREELRALVDGLRDISGRSVVITSAVETETGEHLVCGYDHRLREYFRVPYDYLPVRVAGSGDIFSAFMTGALLDGKTLREAVELAVTELSRLLTENWERREDYKGILLERYWR
ncbi:MAG: PfkB family carbohydrate kinase [Clostridiales bacterium]|nr:PfkB family carbohydrate kinase [Clostridiales bacterium]